jgi:DUF971 family protein
MISPQRIELDIRARTLTLFWPDGVTQRIAHSVLRDACRCATCRTLRLRGVDLRAPQDTVLQEIRTAGYGLQLCFSDAHERGIFPWALLASLPSSTGIHASN